MMDVLKNRDKASSIAAFRPQISANRPYNGVIAASPKRYPVPSHDDCLISTQTTRVDCPSDWVRKRLTSDPALKYDPTST